MKVVQLNTGVNGGAAIASLRLNTALKNLGIDSEFLYLRGENMEGVVQYPRRKNSRGLIQKYLRRSKKQQFVRLVNEMEGEYEIYSLPVSDYTHVHEHPLVKEADLIHLHWVSNWIDLPSFFRNCRKPVIWTLHDMNPFMGGFHYEGDLNINQNHFEQLEERLKSIKRKAYPDQMTIVSPSRWMMQKAKNSDLLGRYQHVRIPNGIPVEVFNAEVKDLRDELGIGPDMKVLLFVAEKLSSRRKGFDLLLSALEGIDNKQCRLLSVGREVPEVPSEIIQVGYIKDESAMASLYRSADAFVLPSREDNLPNVMLESLACGTPVIAYQVGGIPDVVQDGEIGILAEECTAQSLGFAIEKFLKFGVKKGRSTISQMIHQDYGIHSMVNKYIELYKDILK